MKAPTRNTQLVILFASLVFVAGLSAFIGYKIAHETAEEDPSAKGDKSFSLETTSTPPISEEASHTAYIRENNVWLRSESNENQITSDASPSTPKASLPSVYYSKPVLSPDGRSVAVIRSIGSNTQRRTLQVISLMAAGYVQKLSEDVDWAMDSVQWKQDGSVIYFVSSSPDDYDTKVLNSVAISNGTITKLGNFTVKSGCGGGSSDPADLLTWAENISGWPVTFSLSSDGKYIVHNSTCTGQGLAVFDLSSRKDVLLSEQGTGAVFSGNGNTFAIFHADTISVYDAKTRSLIQTYPVSGPVSSIFYSPDSLMIFYTTSSQTKKLTIDDVTALESLGYSPAEFYVRSTVLNALTLSTGKIKNLSTFEAHNARPIGTNAQGNVVYLALVDNATDLYTYYTTTHSSSDASSHWPKVKVVSVNTDTGVTETYIDNAEQSDRN